VTGGSEIDAIEAIEALTDGERALVAASAERRAGLELCGAASFTVITQALVDLRADTAIVDLSARAIAEEIRHSNIYLELARRYRGAHVTEPRIAPIEAPRHAGCDDETRRVLHVVGMCSVNETMACGFLELCLAGATDAHVRSALREILEDEIRHARIGWALLGSRRLTEAHKREVSRHLGAMIAAQLAGWRAQMATLPAAEVPAHGCPSAAAIERAAIRTLREVVLPGFAHVGVDATAARAMLA
jgi:hypothetical protein